MFRETFRSFRKARGLNQIELGDILGVSQGTIASWENGTRRPDIEMLAKIADYFGVSTDILLDRKSKEEADQERDLWDEREAERRSPDRGFLLKLGKYGSERDVKMSRALFEAWKATSGEDYDGDDPA